MEIRYSREMNHNYMIIEAPEKETGYAVQMLSAVPFGRKRVSFESRRRRRENIIMR